MTEWKWWFDFLWPIFLAVPGAIAFWWSWRDRATRAKAENPFGEWTFERTPQGDGWYAAQISVKNRWDERLFVRHIRVKGLRGTTMAIMRQSPNGSEPDLAGAASSHDVEWEFWSSTQTGAKESSGATILYVKPPKDRYSGNAQSGSGDTLSDVRMSKLRLVLTVTSPSNRAMRLTAKHKWTSKPLTNKRLSSPTKANVSA